MIGQSRLLLSNWWKFILWKWRKVQLKNSNSNRISFIGALSHKYHLYLYLERRFHLIQVTHKTIIFFLKAVTSRPPPERIVWLVSRFKYTKTQDQSVSKILVWTTRKRQTSVSLLGRPYWCLCHLSHM